MTPNHKLYAAWLESDIKKQTFGKAPASLYEPIRYLMSLGGKRLRPMLTLMAYSLFKSDVRSIVRYAVAVEAFHNFTLMHDDIMDKAPLRRGKPTVHEKWNINTAILSGDVMLVKVYEMFQGLDPVVLKEVLSVFNTCAAEVCEGQQLDMEFETTDSVSEARYMEMIRKKTAVLLGFSLELGAILARATSAERKALREFGVQIGIAFQLMDDYLDAYADPTKFGKQVGGDIIANKKTWLLIKARELARGRERKELTEWLQARKFNHKKKIAAFINLYDRLSLPKLIKRKISQHFERAFARLSKVNGNAHAIKALSLFTKKLAERET